MVLAGHWAPTGCFMTGSGHLLMTPAWYRFLVTAQPQHTSADACESKIRWSSVIGALTLAAPPQSHSHILVSRQWQGLRNHDDVDTLDMIQSKSRTGSYQMYTIQLLHHHHQLKPHWPKSTLKQAYASTLLRMRSPQTDRHTDWQTNTTYLIDSITDNKDRGPSGCLNNSHSYEHQSNERHTVNLSIHAFIFST